MSGEYAEEKALWEIGNFYRCDKRFSIYDHVNSYGTASDFLINVLPSHEANAKALLLWESDKFIRPETMRKNVSPKARPDIEQS